ncbi:flavodoxin domain-containing protein [Terrisporobacter sp.]
MKSIVVYESRYGSTERYANWIGQELKCKVCKISDIGLEELLSYDNIVFGGWLHAGNIKGLKNISDNIEKFKNNNKNLIVFYVGLSILDERAYKEIYEKNFKDMDGIKTFYVRGAFNFQKLNFGDKMMMKAFKLVLKKQKEEEMDDNTRGMLQAYDTPVDFVCKDAINPIIESVNYNK